MKIVVLVRGVGSTRTCSSLVRALCARGHKVKLVYGTVVRETGTDRAKGLALLQEECGIALQSLCLPVPQRAAVLLVRRLIDFRSYQSSLHPNPQLGTRMISDKTSGRTLSPLAFLARKKWAGRLLTYCHSRLTPSPQLVDFYRREEPDIVIGYSNLAPGTIVHDHFIAARAAGIRTILSVLSFDNPTTKGTLHCSPDYVFVWNRMMAAEMEKIHGTPGQSIFKAGAANFDGVFGLQPTVDRDSFCRSLGFDPAQKLLLYVGSSRLVGSEVELIESLLGALRVDSDLKDANLIIRPHPTNSEFVMKFASELAGKQVRVFPATGEFCDLDEATQTFVNSLRHSQVVIGLNTSAFIEAAIIDKPIVTIVFDKFQRLQTGLAHYRQFLDYGFMEEARSQEELRAILHSTVVEEADRKASQRRAFVADFIRPGGLHRSVGSVVADALEVIHAGGNPNELSAGRPEVPASGLTRLTA